ncbi:hypothetical protein PYCCODRAFT_1431721 [Trametes coccinea BRFM310]|uniref:Uncharacterized protein n=1 Tax=Trametes coccinea (strain BRFM310) TaxID=1353009 RepID=A0A1Y2J0C7_TRAC3|nr:hypothetical protein PYCCODRAFT_1431721 [Trametes coccinea BRFM310]
MRFQFSLLSLAVLLGVAVAAPLASNDLNARSLPNGGQGADYKRAEVARSCPNGSAGCGEGPL